MNRSRIEAAACRGKVRFGSFARAKVVARYQGRSHKGQKFAPYACRFCSGFHVGEPVGGKRKRSLERREREPRFDPWEALLDGAV